MAYVALSQTTLFSDSTLKAYWPMDGNSNDAKGSNNGTDSSMSYSTTNAKVGSAADFTPQTSKITIADATDVQNIFDGGGSIGSWIYPTTTTDDSGRILDKGGDSGTMGWALYTTGASGGNTKLSWFQNFANGSQIRVETTSGIPINTLHHVIVTYDNSSSSNVPAIYIDGASVSYTTNASPTGGRGSDVGQSMGIGQRTSTANVGYSGSLDEMFIFKRSLSATEVANLYSGALSTSSGNLVGFEI